VPEAVKEAGLYKSQAIIEEAAIASLARSYCREAGVRNLKQHIEKISRKVAYLVASGETRKATVTADNLEKFVGMPVFTTDRFYTQPPAGVVMGLAWTSMGGSTLYIETVCIPVSEGKSRLQTTGQMGDVMKEGTAVCYTYARRFLSEIDPTNDFFDKNEVHMHIPEGATPKDGPSAGVTMVTALLSLATQRQCRAEVAMTGELSLTGKVLKIGGVKEKIIAAKRSEITHVILPLDNERDFDELPDFIKKDVTVHYADSYADVFAIAFAPQHGEESV